MQILLIEDDKGDSVYIEEILVDHKIDSKSSLPGDGLKLSNYDLVICDYFICGGTILDYFKTIKEEDVSLPPFILISGKIDEIVLSKIPPKINSYLVSKNNHFKEMLLYYTGLIDEVSFDKKQEVLDYKTLFLELVHDLRNDLALSANYKEVSPLFDNLEEELDFLRNIKNASLYAYNRVSTLSDFVNSNTKATGTIRQALACLEASPLLESVISKTSILKGGDLVISSIPLYFLSVILKNLMENSYKYASNKSELQINIFVEQRESELIITICDNGDGIPAEKVNSLFLKKQESSGGMGIGLVILNRIVEIYKGHISVNSEVGVGTKIQISFENH